MSRQILYLSPEEVAQSEAMEMKRVIESLEEVFRLHHKGECVVPSKLVLPVADDENRGRLNAIAMPGYLGGEAPAAGIKWLGNASLNPKHQLPRSTSMLVLNDPHTMLPIAILDGTQINAYRTGAATGVAAKYLARKDARKAGLIGAGVQNRTQLLALKTVCPTLETVVVYDIDPARARQFAAEMSTELQMDVVTAVDVKEAVAGQHIVVTATTARAPIVDREWLDEGSFYAHIGGYEAHRNVIHGADKIVVDDWEKVRDRKSSTLSLMYHDGEMDERVISSSLGEIVTGSKLGRETMQEFIYFNATGLAVHDIMIGQKIYEEAKLKGRGTVLPFG